MKRDSNIIMNKYARKYPYVINIGLFKICIITVHAHAVGTSLSPPPPTLSEGLLIRLAGYSNQSYWYGNFS